MAVRASREKPVVEFAKTTSEFDKRWDDAPALKKQDRLPLLARPLPTQLMSEPNSVERITPDVPARVPLVMTSQEDKLGQCCLEAQLRYAGPVTKYRRHVARDICTRHGKRKVAIRGGRSWRCQ